jgi:hypothetical protein
LVAVCCFSTAHLTPSESLFFHRNRAERKQIHRKEKFMTRKARRKESKAKQPNVDWKALDIVHPAAAGIDIGGSEHWVAISPERDPQSDGVSTASPKTSSTWRTGCWREECGA